MRRLIVAALTVIGLTGTAVVVAAPAYAGSGFPACGNTCDLKDPDTYTLTVPGSPPDHPAHYWCADDAITAKRATASLGGTTYTVAELRYSDKCETTWFRLGNAPVFYGQTRMYSRTSVGGTLRKSTYQWAPSGLWSVMLNDHNLYNNVCADWYLTEDDQAAGRNKHTACSAAW